MSEYERENDFTVYLFKYLFLLGLVIIIFDQFFDRPLITHYINYIISSVIALGFFIFSSSLERVEQEIEDENENEALAEERRQMEFNWKFPIIAKLDLNYGFRYSISEKNIPLLIIVTLLCPFIFLIRSVYKFVKWMYKEGWSSLILIFIVLIGAYFYFNCLGNYGFQGDEYYHAMVVKTYFETGKLFYINDISYTRSSLTSLLVISSKYIFDFLGINASEEFILRFPIALISLFSIILIYLISKIYINKKYSLLITLIYTTEVWFIYFARYLRFYSIALFISLLIFYLSVLNLKNKKILLVLLVLSIFFSIVVIDYIFVLSFFILYLLIKELVNERRYSLISFMVLVAIVLIIFLYFYISYKNNNYLSLRFDYSKMSKEINYLLLNYSFILIPFILSIFLINKKPKELYLYTLFNFLFLIFYITMVSSYFSFRPIYFFLPLMFILAIISLRYCFNNRNLLFTFLFFILILNFCQSLNYPINSPGDFYYPTKLIYERSDIIESSKDIPVFLNEYIHNESLNNDSLVILIGGGGISAYSDILKVNYVFSSVYSDSVSNDLQDMESILNDNKDKRIFLIAYANAYPNRINFLYFYLWSGTKYVTQANPTFVKYLETNNNFKLVYTSQDRYSKVFEYNHP
jgi:hypothetical protein